MRNRLLLPIDYSPYSEAQLKVAQEWSKSLLAEIIVIHQATINIPFISDDFAREMAMNKERIEMDEKLKDYVASILPKANNVKCLVIEEDLAEGIKALKDEQYNDMVILGLKGTGLLKKIFIGSHTVQLIEQLNQQILAVPKHMDIKLPETLHLAVHYKYGLQVEAIEKLLDFMNFRIKNIHLVSVIHPNDDKAKADVFLELLKTKLLKLAPTTSESFIGSNAFADLKNYIQKKHGGLLCIQKGGRDQFEPEFRSFLINELAYDASVPMLVLPF